MQWSLENQVIIKFSLNYYPPGDGLAESMNKNLIIVIRCLLKGNPRDWHTQHKYALWMDRFRVKNSLGTSSYLLVYGQELVFPLNLKILVLKLMNGYVEDADRVQIRLMNLSKRDEKQKNSLEHMEKH